MVSKAIQLLQSASKSGVSIFLTNGHLQVKFTKGSGIDPTLLSEIRANKELLTAFLNNSDFKTAKLESYEAELLTINRNDYPFLPLSYSQERLWFIDKLEGSIQYHIPAVLRIKGILNKVALEQSFQAVMERHEVLRTVMLEDNGQAYQHIKQNNWQLRQSNGSHFAGDAAGLQQYISACISAPFNLNSDDMLRAELIELNALEHVLVVTLHHIASDGWSFSILVGELVENYNAFVQGRTSRLTPLPLQYADYALWQRHYLVGEVLANKASYWKNKLDNVSPLQLPTDYNRPHVQSSRGAVVNFSVNKEVTADLQALSLQQGSTLFMTLLSAFKVLLYRYSGQQDICVGTPIAGRQQQELEGLIGFFINTLALRTLLNPQESFTALLQQVKATTLQAYAHQEVPFDKVVEQVIKERDLSRSPLFQVMFVLQNTPETEGLSLAGASLQAEALGHTTAKFDISFTLRETPHGLRGTIEYCTDLYKVDTIERMSSHYHVLLQSIVQHADWALSALPLLGSGEEKQLLYHFNNTAAAYPTNQSITNLFEVRSSLTPHAVAIVFGEDTLSYVQLNNRANQLAHYLQSQGVTKETLIPICLERSIEMIVGLLAILKAGGAYVPIDPEYPAERIAFMLQDTAATMVLSSSQSKASLPEIEGLRVIEIGQANEQINKRPVTNLPTQIHPQQLAYVIYTSGSTGKPKGVMVEHGNVFAFIMWCQSEFAFSHFDVAYASTSICFDLSVYEIFYPLTIGKKIRVLESGLQIENFVTRDANILINTVPMVVEALLKEGTDLSRVNVINMAGEPIPQHVLDGLDTVTTEVRNLYGPSEDTTYSTFFRMHNGQPILIGKPIANTQVYITGSDDKLVPIGIPGEICLGGAGLSRGYLNNETLTKEKFVANPFSVNANERLYKTGDIGRWLSDGNIEYLGRKDEQVKIRGYRIELGEIENVLLQSRLVSQAVVTAKEDPTGNKRLVGYVVAEDGFDKEATLAFLEIKLPHYMVPALWVQLEKMPLTTNGKIDKKSLPIPEFSDSHTREFVAPRNEIEITLAEVWQNLMGIERIGIHDNFFELGGHSLLIMRLISAIRKELNADLHVKDLFIYPSISKLAERIKNLQGSQEVQLKLQLFPRPELIPLSFSQERLWFIHQLEGSVQYHVPAVLTLKGDLNLAALKNAFAKIIERHEVLRTVFIESNGKAFQRIYENVDFSLPVIQGWEGKQETPGFRKLIKELINTPYDLSKDVMLRAHIIPVNKDEHILVVVLHHVASDAWSRTILVREITEFYNGYNNHSYAKLIPLPLQYADFAVWQRNYLQGENLSNKLDYWKRQLNDLTPLAMPADHPRTTFQSINGKLVGCTIDEKVYAGLKDISNEHGTTLFMTLLTALNIFLHKYTGSQDICIGTPIAGRDQQELEGLIGFFVNTLAIRNNVSDDVSFGKLLKQVKVNTLNAIEHGDVPFEKVVDAVVKERDASRSPIFQVMFVLQNASEIPEVQLANLQLSPFVSEHDIAKYELTFLIAESNNRLKLSIEYNADLFEETTIKRMLSHFNELLVSIIHSPKQFIRDLSILSVEEKKQILQNFNNPAVNFPKDKTIIDLFEEQVTSTPLAPAVIFEDLSINFLQLNQRANQFAHFLKTKGVKAETLVPVCIERGVVMIVTILGILKAGGAYVPIDTQYPDERKVFMLKDVAADLVITSKVSANKLPLGFKINIISIDEFADDICCFSTDNLTNQVQPTNLAYIIYTSGSTGTPKGVMIEHGGVVNLACSQVSALKLVPEMRTLQFASFGFDASCYEIFNTLLSGGTLVIPNKEDLLSASLFEGFITANAVQLAVLPPSFQQEIKDHTGTLQTIVSAGEPLNPTIATHFRAKEIRMINAYGPTENTVCATLTDDPIQGDVVTIGKPIANVQVYITDKFNNLCPVGISGEICIAGSQVARGYLNRDALSSEKFIYDPFNKMGNRKIYKTGDSGRWLPGGNIEYLGRMDDQLKIRGHRIEPGEIEMTLLQSGLVTHAVVIAKEDEGRKRLVGYFVSDENISKDNIISWLQDRLPEYMVPALWMRLDKLPLTANGKIDKRALPAFDIGKNPDKQFVAPSTDFEIKLATIWQELLGLETVGITDNFFELGGDSITTIQVVSRLRHHSYELQPRDLFLYQTIGRLSAIIHDRASAVNHGEQGILTGTAGLLPIQQWYLNNASVDVSHFNQVVLLSIDKKVISEDLNRVYQQLLQQHDALRFNYSQTINGWQQQYSNHVSQVISEDLSTIPATSTLAFEVKESATRHQSSLDIFKGDLVRFVHIQTPVYETHNRLLMVIHHLAVDGVSWRILLEDIEELISKLDAGQAPVMASKTSSYRQWYLALVNYSKTRTLQSQKKYWQKVVQSYQPLPFDNPHATNLVSGIKSFRSILSKDLTRQLLLDVPGIYHTEINDILLAGLAKTIADHFKTGSVHIGLEGHGREYISNEVDVSHTVGWFTTLYPLMVALQPDLKTGDLIKSVKEQLRQVPVKGLGFGILKYLEKDEKLQGADPFDIIFNYLGQLDNVVNNSKWFNGAGETTGQSRSKAHVVHEKISLGSFIQAGELVVNWHYSSNQISEATLQLLAAAYISNLQHIIEHCLHLKKKMVSYNTPADYNLTGEASYEELDQFFNEDVGGHNRRDLVSGIYRLSGLQQGMLFHSYYQHGTAAYINQFQCDLIKPNLQILQQSWQHIVKHHSILRTAFYSNVFSIPVQVVYKDVEMPVEFRDFSMYDPAEQAEALKRFAMEDRKRGFDVATPPLMRLTLCKLNIADYQMLWTSHHLLTDGWSIPILVQEFLTNYETLASARQVETKEEDKYEDYIRYIETINKDDEEANWKRYLAEVEDRTFLPQISATERLHKSGEYKSLYRHLSTETTLQVQQFAQKNRLTINTIMQGVHALLLHQYTGNDKVVFGITTSGRPIELKNIDQRVGMYINTLPLLSIYNQDASTVDWLHNLQTGQVSLLQYQYTLLSDIQKWTGIKGEWFDTTLTFQNFPVSEEIVSNQWSLNVKNAVVHEQNTSPLSLTIANGKQISVRIMYNTILLQREMIDQLWLHFQQILKQVISGKGGQLEDIRLLSIHDEQIL